ncbi:hypothetical protein [Marimonas arenosa]|uniref:50S ribosomal protein L35 n=1 Tax=Marimonas arenosa TaxID=1795305 RepID=A0AAE3WBR6_9RHOB|nr:hypothetical protein [Marimonas arenosa]MDQ2089787.1 hypothetical protein [Marimonas arenosa]
MDSDLALVVGLVVAVFSVPAVISALSERRAPRVAAIVLIVGGGLVAWSVSQKPGGYTLGEIPDVIVRVVGRYVN